MPGPDLPEIPTPLKSIQHYIKIAAEHDQRDPVVSYWARLYALQVGLKLSTKTTAENNFLLQLMDWLETTKKAHLDNEAITNDVAAQAHLENWALKLFLYADKNDRESNYNKSVIQSFYTAGLLYDVLTTFGELTEEATQNRKYAKWKAAYIHNCLKNGETPVPGPMKEEGEEDDDLVNLGPGPDISLDNAGDSEPAEANDETEENQADVVPSSEPEGEPEGEPATPDPAEDAPSEPGIDPASGDEDMEASTTSQPTPPPATDAFGFPALPGGSTSTTGNNSPQPSGNMPYPTLMTPASPNPYNPAPTPTSPTLPTNFPAAAKPSGSVELDTEKLNKAQKYIKWASSAINYDDVPTAIGNLQKALHLLTTGQDS